MSASPNFLQDKRVVVVGGGFAGMTAALQLVGQGAKVTLVEKETALGGFFPLLDNTFPTHSCGVCYLAPRQPAYCPFIECQLARNLEVKTASRPLALTGESGNFRLTIESAYLGVDAEKCIDCGRCAEVCPVSVPYEFSDGLEKRTAIYKLYPKMVKGGWLVDQENCTRCGACVDACPTAAIELDKTDTRTEELTAEAVLLAPGFSLEEGTLKGEYGFGRYANVVTSRQFERMISYSGPTAGRPRRVSDGREVSRIAFIQCVGSRDISCGRGYCSAVCCMYATKQAIFARQRLPECKVVVYYMDLRGMGKDYEKYFNRAKNEYGIEYRRSMVSTVREDPRSGQLNLVYDTGSGFAEEGYDLVVLSLGFDAPRLDFATAAGIELDEYGFCRTPEFDPTVTSKLGVYAAGAFCGPKDIPESVLEAQAAAARLAAALAPGCGVAEETASAQPSGPGEGEVWQEVPKIGIFLCACGGTLAQGFDSAVLQEEFSAYPYVACVESVDDLCTQEGLRGLRRYIGENELNRLLLVACSPRVLNRQIAAFADEIGFNANAFTVVNLREQVLFPFADAPEAATNRARAQIRAALTSLFRTLPAPGQKSALEPRVLVVGGGVAGLSAALNLAAVGVAVTLIEKNDRLGGRLEQSKFTLEGGKPGELLTELSERVKTAGNIEILLEAKIVAHSGRPGDFTTQVLCGETNHLVRHGALIVATGAAEAGSNEYLCGESPRVITQSQLEERMAVASDIEALNEVIMIQCVGSREPGGREYCSRVCCTHALKNALKLKELCPGVRITVFYRDLRAYGLFEEYYRRAREIGVIFTPYELDRKPVVEQDGDSLRLSYYDQVLRREMSLRPDLLVLSTGIEPAAGNAALAEIFDLPLDDYGFFAEANAKAALVDFPGEGRYLCGLAAAPVHFREAIIRARAAAGRAATFLGQREIKANRNAVTVNTRLCSGCGLCVETCPYGARTIDPATMIAEVDYALCHGCGACAAACPNGATQQIGFDKGQIMAMVQNLV